MVFHGYLSSSLGPYSDIFLPATHVAGGNGARPPAKPPKKNTFAVQAKSYPVHYLQVYWSKHFIIIQTKSNKVLGTIPTILED